MKKTNTATSPLAKAKASFRKGFSLIELLVVIAVIGIIAAIAIPNIAGLTGSAGEAAARRNAQNIVSVYSSAIAAGYSAPATRAAMITAITTTPGVTGTGTLSDSTFLAEMPAEDANAASVYIDDTNLSYEKAGGNTPTTL